MDFSFFDRLYQNNSVDHFIDLIDDGLSPLDSINNAVEEVIVYQIQFTN